MRTHAYRADCQCWRCVKIRHRHQPAAADVCKFCGAPSTRVRRSPYDGMITGESCDAHVADLMTECLTVGYLEAELERMNRATAQAQMRAAAAERN